MLIEKYRSQTASLVFGLEELRNACAYQVIDCATVHAKISYSKALMFAQMALSSARERHVEISDSAVVAAAIPKTIRSCIDALLSCEGRGAACLGLAFSLKSYAKLAEEGVRGAFRPLKLGLKGVISDLTKCIAALDGGNVPLPAKASFDEMVRIEGDIPRISSAIPDSPARPPGIEITPPFMRCHDQDIVVEKLHAQIFNVEICAAELCAMMLCRFPDAPFGLQCWLARQVWDEGRHAEILLETFEGDGGVLGEYPIHLGIWLNGIQGKDIIECLALEQVIGEGFSIGADLYHSARYATLERHDLAELYQAIHIDEFNHARQGLNWFRQLAGPANESVLIKMESLVDTCPLEDPYFFEGIRKAIGFTPDEIARQRARAVQPMV